MCSVKRRQYLYAPVHAEPTSRRHLARGSIAPASGIPHHTDFAGNAEVQNKRRSQVGILATLNCAPVYWKASVIQCYANENFEEDHPDRSSGASETRGAGNATYTMDFLHLSYIAREAGMRFPKPLVLQIDNDAARIFANAMDTCFRSRMKHIDCAQEWVNVRMQGGPDPRILSFSPGIILV